MTSLGREFRTLKDDGLSTRSMVGLLKAIVRHGKLPELASFIWWELCYRMGPLRRIRFTPDIPATPNGDWVGLTLSDIGGGSDANLGPSPEPWMLLYVDSGGDAYGCLYTAPTELLHRSPSGQITEIARFDRTLVSVFVAEQRTIFVCLNDGSIHRSEDATFDFTEVLTLSTEVSFFRFDHGMVETSGGLLAIAEYGNVRSGDGWQSLAYLYYSADGGRSWERSDFLVEQGVNKHSHLLRYSSRLDALILTVGDNRKQTWLAPLVDGLPADGAIRWKLCHRRHVKTGGFTALVETDSKLLFGTDYHGGTNFIVETEDCRSLRKRALPDPYRRAPIYAMAQRASSDATEIWATLHNAVHRGTRSLVMMTRDGGASWTRVLDYDGARNRVRFASAGGHGKSETMYLYVTTVGDDDAEQPLTTLKVGPRSPSTTVDITAIASSKTTVPI